MIPQEPHHQTWYVGAPSGEDELIRFLGGSAQHQRSKVNEYASKYACLTVVYLCKWVSSLPSLSLDLE